MQVQTNIAQFFRKHKLNPFPPDPDKNQDRLRVEYSELLQQIEAKANQKEEESKR